MSAGPDTDSGCGTTKDAKDTKADRKPKQKEHQSRCSIDFRGFVFATFVYFVVSSLPLRQRIAGCGDLAGSRSLYVRTAFWAERAESTQRQLRTAGMRSDRIAARTIASATIWMHQSHAGILRLLMLRF